MDDWVRVAALLGIAVAGVGALHLVGAWRGRARRYADTGLRYADTGPWYAGTGPRPEPVSPFTGGVPPAEHAFSRYHVRWYAVAMIFLAFDMEMLFMYPWVRVVAETGTAAVVEMFLFLGILFAGVLYAWREGALRWS